MSAQRMWVVVRIDHFLEDLFAASDKRENPADSLVTVTHVYAEQDSAARDVARLSKLRDSRRSEYFAAETELCSRSTGADPVALVGITDYQPGEAVARGQVRLGGIWESVRTASEHMEQQRDERTIWGLHKARIVAPSAATR